MVPEKIRTEETTGFQDGAILFLVEPVSLWYLAAYISLSPGLYHILPSARIEPPHELELNTPRLARLAATYDSTTLSTTIKQPIYQLHHTNVSSLRCLLGR